MLRSARALVAGTLLVGLAALVLWSVGADDRRPGPETAPERGGAQATPGLRASAAKVGTAVPESATLKDGTSIIPPWPIGPAPEQNAGTGRVHVLLLDSKGRPLPNHPIEVSWWKAFGVMGDDGGVTDADGRFRTNADKPWHLDAVSLPASEAAPFLYHSGPFAAAPGRPYEVRVIVPAGGVIRGRVLDSTGAPRVGVLVEAERASSLPADPFAHPMHFSQAQNKTAAAGTFSLPVVLGSHRVRIKSSALKAVSELRVHLTVARPTVDVVLRTDKPVRGRTIRVTIAGAAPAGTRVTAYTDETVIDLAPKQEGVIEVVQRTRRKGRRLDDSAFKIEGVRGEGWRIVISVPGAGRRASARHGLPAGATQITIPLPDPPSVVPDPTRTVRVIARKPDGTTVAPHVYVLRSYDLGQMGSPPDFESIDGETHVRLYDHQGEVYLLVDERDHALAALGPFTKDTAPKRILVELQAPGAADVRVVDAAGRPVAAELTLQPAWSFFRPIVAGRVAGRGERGGFRSVSLPGSRVITADEGRTTFSQLGDEAYQVTARPTDETLPSARGVLRAGQSLRLVLGTGYRDDQVLRGRVIDFLRRSPLAGIRIEAVTDDTEHGHAWASGETKNDGTFTLRGLPARTTRFRLFGEGWAFPQNSTLDLTPTKEGLVFALHAARRLPLLVVDGEGEPIEKAVVSFVWPDGGTITTQDAYGNMGDETDVTDSGGRVDLLGLPATRIVLIVSRPGEPTTSASRHEIDLTDPVRKLVILRHAR